MGIDEIIKKFNNLPEYIIELGVPAGENKQEKNRPLNNAELLFIHEYGTVNIPARPVLRMTIDWAKNTNLIEKTKQKCIKEYIKSGYNERVIDDEINKLASRMQSHAQEIIYSNDGRLTPNAESTIRAKGFNHPLFVTGSLARSIQGIVEKYKR